MSAVRAPKPHARGVSRTGREAPTARAIIVGNEILTGKIADQNLSVLARTLRALGVRLTGATTIPDELRTIAREVRSAAKSHDWVFTSGGVGPTHDDVTIDAVARAFSQPVVISRALTRLIRTTYADKLRDGHLLMARVPRGSKLVASQEIPWPVVRMKNVWVLPGVPEIFEMKMRLVEKTLGVHPTFHSLALLTRLDEGNLKPLLDEVVAAYSDVDIGSYPRWTDPLARTKLTFDGHDRTRLEEARSSLAELLPEGALVGFEG